MDKIKVVLGIFFLFVLLLYTVSTAMLFKKKSSNYKIEKKIYFAYVELPNKGETITISNPQENIKFGWDTSSLNTRNKKRKRTLSLK